MQALKPFRQVLWLQYDWLRAEYVDNSLLRILRDHVYPDTDEYLIEFSLSAFVSNRYSCYCFVNQIAKSRQDGT